MENKLKVKGARTHNLKNISVELPKSKLVVITGPSGSGKSSLAFDTIYAEGQRRYVESLSAYARQFLQLMDKPDVDSIEGLSPAISIEQKTTSNNPRSTVGTVTEIYDYLRLLFARVGVPHSPATGLPIESQSVSQMIDRLMELPEGSKIVLLAPVVQSRKGEYKKEILEFKRKGFQRLKVDGEIYDIDDVPTLDKKKKHSIDVVVDRLVINQSIQDRLADSLQTALNLSDGLVLVDVIDQEQQIVLSARFACPVSGFSLKEIEPRLFSFNSPQGACPHCDGLGIEMGMVPFDVSSEKFEAVLQNFLDRDNGGNFEEVCSACHGYRLKPEALCVKICGKHIGEVAELSIAEALKWVQSLTLTPKQTEIAQRILKELTDRLSFLVNVGINYLTLCRKAGTLSGGESQRIRLASQIGSGLTGVLYVLDEPSIGLHQRDNDRLIETLKRLRDLGNTVIVVEHDEDTMRACDHIVDMGPGAGVNGGAIIAEGTLQDIEKNEKSLTGLYLTHKRFIPVPQERRSIDSEKILKVLKASINNLKDISVDFPLSVFTCVTGVSGGGKSSLVLETLYKELVTSLNTKKKSKNIEGIQHIDKVIDIDQSPIGRTPRSNPATYVGYFTAIRDWFANLPESKARGYAPGRFSFNVAGGRCEGCEGDGVIKIAMNFLPDVYVQCDQCHGKRYNRQTLEIKYKDKTISDILDMTIDEAIPFWENHSFIHNKLKTLQDVGLGYMALGQPATTLSGGEAQRIKLAKELGKRSTGKTVFILDEPTTGLHFQDVEKLLEVLQRLVNQGNTVIVIEHNLEVIKTADWIIDVGPEGGEKGGQIVAIGTPEDVSKCEKSHTGRYLKPYLLPKKKLKSS